MPDLGATVPRRGHSKYTSSACELTTCRRSLGCASRHPAWKQAADSWSTTSGARPRHGRQHFRRGGCLRGMPTETMVGVEALLGQERWVRRLARALIQDGDEAEDILQETRVTSWRRPPRDPERLQSWLGTVVRNLVRNRKRADGVRQRLEGQLGARRRGGAQRRAPGRAAGDPPRARRGGFATGRALPRSGPASLLRGPELGRDRAAPGAASGDHPVAAQDRARAVAGRAG